MLRTSVPLFRAFRQAILFPQLQGRYNFSNKLQEKGKGDQDVYFSKEDKKLIKKLLEKMESEGTVSQYSSQEKEDVQAILSRYKITYTEALVEDLLEWKKL